MKQINHELSLLKNLSISILVVLIIFEALNFYLPINPVVMGQCFVLAVILFIIVIYRKVDGKQKIWKAFNFFIQPSLLLLFSTALTLIMISACIYYELSIIEINLSYWIIGYIIIFIFAFISHLIVYILTINKLRIDSDLPKKSIFSFENQNKSLIALFLISPDYMSAYLYKELLNKQDDKKQCEKRKNEKYCHYNYEVKLECKLIGNKYECEIHENKRKRKLFILYSNWLNLIVTSYLIIFAIFDLYNEFLPPSFLELTIVVIIMRTFSRVIEITYAFYNDVVSTKMTAELEIGERTSNLKRGNRISLAVHSYLEITLLFALISYLLDLFTGKSLSGDYINNILYSFSVSAFNVSFPADFSTFNKFLHVIQVGTSMTLVILALASYLGIKDEMNEYEKSDWRSNKYI